MRLLLGLLILAGALLVPSLLAGGSVLASLRGLAPAWLALVCLHVLLAWGLDALRAFWMLGPHLKARLTPGRAFMLHMAIGFSTRATPFGSGGPVAAISLLKPYGVGAHRVAAVSMTTILLDACAVLLWTGIVLCHAIAGAGEQYWRIAGTLLLAILLLFILFSMIVASRWRPLLRMGLRVLQALGVKEASRRRLARFVLEVAHVLREMFRLPTSAILRLVATSIAYWTVLLSMLWTALNATGGNVGWLDAASVQLLALTAGFASTLPSGAVGTELVAAWLLLPMVQPQVAGAAILLWRFMMLYSTLLVGFFCLLRLGKAGFRRRKAVKP